MIKHADQKMKFVEEYKEYYGKVPSAKELQYFDGNASGVSNQEIKNIKKMHRRFDSEKISDIRSESKKRKVIETTKKEGVYVPLKYPPVPVEPRPLVLREEPVRAKPKSSWWDRRKKGTKNWFGERKAGASEKYIRAADKGSIAWRNKGRAIDKSTAAINKGARTAANFGYALPGPLAVFTLAWQSTTKALKLLTVLVFALVILFIPWGIYYYTAWAIAAAFMFLISLIFWVFVSLFNGIAYALVAIINGVVTVIMSTAIWIFEAILAFFTRTGMKWVPNPEPAALPPMIHVPNSYWTEGHVLMHNSLIRYDQITSIPSLMTATTPGWTSWMNDTIIGHILGLLGVSLNFSWLTKPFSDFYSSLDTTQAVAVGGIIIAIPIVFLVVVYFKNRHHLY